MKKLIIQIPCFNEAQTLEQTIAAIPRAILGFDEVELLVIDDGSTDETVAIAKKSGVDHVVSHPNNLGLARAFMTGLEACNRLGADVIVNTDGDNQYAGEDIQCLTAPILAQTADIVVGARDIDAITHFSPIKKMLQKLGSWVVRLASGTSVMDAPSGFRAFTCDAARRLVVFNDYTYTLETLIQAGQSGLIVASVPVRTNEVIRPSRLMSGSANYIYKSAITILRIFAVYRPTKFFGAIGLALMFMGCLVGLRFLRFYLDGDGGGHIQSLILASICLIMGFQSILVAFLAESVAANRKLLEHVRYLSQTIDK